MISTKEARHAAGAPRFTFGARLLDHSHTRFRLWAPDKTAIDLEIEGRTPLCMHAMGGGWFEREVDCGAGSRYRYRVDALLAVPDPASHAQAGDVHDCSVVVDHQAYCWHHPQWRGRPWHETVLYELHVGVLGGFVATMARLPALARLGITAIELMPVADFAGARNWGYDGVLPYAPEATYGTPDELKALVDAAHGLGMMVFLDVVYNHFGPDGNYLNAYAAAFFHTDRDTPWGQAIDNRHQEVRDFFTGNALYWLQDFRFDGLRLDAVHTLCDGTWLVEAAAAIRHATPAGQHVHLVLENADNTAALLGGPAAGLYDAQWHDDAHHVLHVLLTGETEGYYTDYAGQPAQKLAQCLAGGFLFQADNTPAPEQAPLAPATLVWFLQNHDQIGNRAFGERLTTLADPRAYRAAQALLLLTPGIPLLFMGEEMGASEPFFYFTDYAEPGLARAVREGRRQEFSHFQAFSSSALRARIPDPNAPGAFERSFPTPAGQGAHASSWESWVMQLLTLRHTHIVPGLAGARALGAHAIGAAAVAARWQLANATRLTCLLNLDATPIALASDLLTIGDNATLLFDPLLACEAVKAGTLPAFCMIAFLEPGP